MRYNNCNCGKGSSSKNCVKRTNPEENPWYITPEGNDLEDMVRDYRKRFLKPTETWISSLVKTTDFICGEANIKDDPKPDKFCKNSHQYRMPYTTVRKAYEKLSDAGLDHIDNFRDILRKVATIGKRIHNFGQLASYDFTQRYCYSRGILPDVVYLHAGVMEGVNSLISVGYEVKKQKDKEIGCFVELEDLPVPIRDLGTLHAENFLCIYKHLIAKLPPIKK